METENLAKNIKYPLYFNVYNGDDFYLNKYFYLLSQKISVKYRFYPIYIKEEDLSILENKKRIFRFSVSHYCLDDDYFLYFMHDKENIKNI